MGLDRKNLPDRLLRLVRPEDRKRTKLPKPFTEIVTPSMGTVKLYDLPKQKAPKAHGSRYSLPVVLAWFEECGLPKPVPEYRFHDVRLFRVDFAWPDRKVCLEVQGGIFARVPGGHNRGAAIRKEHEKRNLLAVMGWRILYCETETLCTMEVADLVRQALAI